MRFFLWLAFLAPLSVSAAPAEILLLRHAEKPEQGPHLSEKGWERAKALPALFARPELRRYGAPAALFAMAARHEGGSVRAIETLKYVSEGLHLPLDTRFTRDEVGPLVDAILHDRSLDGKLVVVCWEHEVLTEIAEELGVKDAPDYPGKKFDRAWLLTFGEEGRRPELTDLPEHLLPGDDER
jgi:hypothetical protein